MRMILHEVALPLAHPFTISRGTRHLQKSLIVELEHAGVSGFGEATENAFYGHSIKSIRRSLERVEASIHRLLAATPFEAWPHFWKTLEGDSFAMSALDVAAHDWHGKFQKVPCWQGWGIDWDQVPDSSYTIGIDTIEKMSAKINEQSGWKAYKIKLGTPHDVAIVEELRRHTEASFRVDANGGWDADSTIRYSKRLAEIGVEFIEQPLPIDASLADQQRVFRQSALPIIADESCQQMTDVEKMVGLFHGINVKLCKCGGLSPAVTILRTARAKGLKTMVGCMVESSVGICGAAQLLPLLDYADLDGSILLADEPACGVSINKGKILKMEMPGTGAELDRDRLFLFTESSK